MREIPIIFSAPMLRAIIEGRKTQTRRILKPQPTHDGTFWRWHGGGWGSGSPPLVPGHSMWNAVPARPGERLWVREKLQYFGEPGGLARLMHEPLHYAADENPPGHPGPAITTFPDDWRLPKRRGEYIPSIHMPRWASRITLEVTGVKVERLQEISEEDAIAEGIRRSPHGNRDQWLEYPEGSSAAGWEDPRDSFRSLWNSIHGAGAWDANPWVAAISFKRVKS